MATTSEILKEELELLKDELIEAYDAKGMRASGKWANSLEVTVNELSGKITGLKYSEQLEYGRRAGGFPPIDAIEKWIEDKGIKPIDDKIKTRSLAFLIARKIANQGWDRQGFEGVDLITEVITPARIQKIINRIETIEVLKIVSDITRLIERLQKV